MKKSLALIAAAAWPALALAQSPAPPAPSAEAAAPAAPAEPTPPKTLDRVEFQDADLQTIIDFLKEKNQALGGNPRDLNVVLSPGLEKLRVPMLSLRNVSVTDVLTIATTVLELETSTIYSESTGEVVALLVKAPQTEPGTMPTGAGIMVRPPETAPGAAAGAGIGAPAPGGHADVLVQPADPSSPEPVRHAAPPVQPADVVELAASAPALAGPPGRPAPRVFGVASLIRSTKTDPAERRQESQLKFNVLMENLQNFADEQGNKTEVKAYPNLEIVVVKSLDAASLSLIAEAIEAMKLNAASH